jgi:hypothetical protein
MIVNAPKSLSIAAAPHPDVSASLDAALADAADEIRRYLAWHATTRVGPRGAQEVVAVEGSQTVSIVHHTSRAGDPARRQLPIAFVGVQTKDRGQMRYPTCREIGRSR